MRNAETTLAIIRERGTKGLHLEGAYRRLYNPDLFLMAYGRLYRNAGALTEGTGGETVDGMSMEKIHEIIELLRNERFRWSPVRRVYIPKRDGKKRPLGIPNFNPDRLLQEVMRSILDAYYEPQFSPNSHGFRPGRGCHTALRDIFHAWTGTKWFIEGDIKGCFDNIDHSKLIEILGDRIHDNRFLRLIENLLKAGYMEDWERRPTLSGTPQGGVISPILSNIYLDRLDKYVESVLIPKYTRGVRKKRAREYNTLACKARRYRRRGLMTEARAFIEAAKKLPSADQFDDGWRRLRYIRYADDFLLGFDGPKAEAEEIKGLLRQFLRDDLKLEMSPAKTLVTHASTDAARFLGYEITTRNSIGRPTGDIRLRIPNQVIEDKIARYSKAGKPTGRFELTDDTDFSIIEQYGSEYRGFVHYYAHAKNRFWLNRLQWYMRISLLKTLATKHKTTVSKMAKRFAAKAINRRGIVKCLMTTNEREGKEPLIARFGGESLSPEPFKEIEDYVPGQDRLRRRTELEKRLTADECEICTSRTSVQVHHVRALKDLKVKGQELPYWKQLMATRKRKTLVVCRRCHLAIHGGKLPSKQAQSNG